MPFPVRDAAARERERRRRREEEPILETSSKRRKLETINEDSSVVKQERSPPPANLRTSGVFFVRYPSNCALNEANCRANRENCLRQEAAKLQALGVIINRTLIRDDGLAFDWTSHTPIDPVALNRPRSIPEIPRIPSPSDNSNPISSVDLLGHALRDQSVRQSVAIAESAVQPALPDVTRLMNVDRPVTPIEISSDEHSEIPVVGAAVRDTTSDDNPADDSSSPQEYRRLIPMELRIYQQHENKPKYRLHEPVDRRRRRIEWIQKEIEKIEGYTGEKVIGYKYDRNVVVISLKARSNNTPAQTMHLQPGRSTPTAPKSHKKQPVEASKDNNQISTTKPPTDHASLPKAKPVPTHPPPKIPPLGNAQGPPSRHSDSQPKVQSQTQPERLTQDNLPPDSIPITQPTNPGSIETASSASVSRASSNVTSKNNRIDKTKPYPNNASLSKVNPVTTHSPPKIHPPKNAQRLPLQPFRPSYSQSKVQNPTQPERLPQRQLPSDPIPSPRPPSPSRITPVETSSSLSVSRSSSNVPPIISKPAPIKPPAEVSSIPPTNGRSNPPESIPPQLQQDPPSTNPPSNPPDTETVESRGLQFLERYLMLYDTDRKGLTSAFTPNATFSLRDDVQGSSVQITTHPSAIVKAIQKLDDALHHSIKGSISYEMTNLDDIKPGAILLTCEGTIVPRNHSHAPTLSFSRIFVLRQNTKHDRDIWPLRIVSEKLILKRI